MILILGKGSLGQALLSKITGSILVGRPEFDFANKQDCDKFIQVYPNPTHIINTIGVLDRNDIWNNLISNFVVPCYLSAWYVDNTRCHVINISSASAWWPSYPGLDFARFSYNLAKESLSNFGRHVNRITVDDNTKGLLTTIEPGVFKSKMSGFRGQEVDHIADCVQLAMDKKLQHISAIHK